MNPIIRPAILREYRLLTAMVLVACAAASSGCAQAPVAATSDHAALMAPTGAQGSCPELSRAGVEALFERWNRSLQTADPWRVVANYAGESLLLPTLSHQPRFSAEEKANYFREFLRDGPVARIDTRQIALYCGAASDTGHYSFQFTKTGATVAARYSFVYRWDGAQWLIASHHSSLVPPR